MCHPQGRSTAKDARSALTRRPARSYAANPLPPAPLRHARRRSDARHERSNSKLAALSTSLADVPTAPQHAHTHLRRASLLRRVHPRVCGESCATPVMRMWRLGPSPRVRGSEIEISGFARRTGPSPRVRGILRRGARGLPRVGSIPACAGNPTSTSRPPRTSRVHPRVCGESLSQMESGGLAKGPSPRVRGIPVLVIAAVGRRGSIPACAGNPGTHLRPVASCRGPPRVRGIRAEGRPLMGACRVHPRVCGESSVRLPADLSVRGPSPRVRGIRMPQPSGPG